ncbi:alpha/beta hydrolase [Leptospira semungkisensis]|uniref:Alpha/beta hydrolase n=1 Tax=Leptospira semungkisensis TaxID=2484985 RepID=A0A4R9G6K4_9LEPT|nr:alpha/beta hydrolase [Leptospira semungkisensis]TGK07238.1 alpha/beta hydrolase [Leptospira semungkisensis]
MLWQKFEGVAARALLSLPNPILRVFGKDIKRGRTLDPKIRAALVLAKIKPKPEHLPPLKARALFRDIMTLFDLEKIELPRVEDFTIPGTKGRIRVRLYSSNQGSTLEPCLLYFHGGGFVIGDLDSHDPPLRFLAKTSGHAILAVDYGLAPESQYPSSWEDAFSAYKWIKENGKALGLDPKKIAVGGDSAGGNLAISISTQAKKEKLPLPLFQILIYPWIDLTQERKSVEEFADGYALTRDLLRYFKKHSLPNSKDWKDPRVTPFLQASLAHSPQTYMVIAGFDPLQDEGLAYADLLKKAKIPLELKVYENLIHGFFNLGRGIPKAKEALYDIAGWIEKGFSKK